MCVSEGQRGECVFVSFTLGENGNVTEKVLEVEEIHRAEGN